MLKDFFNWFRRYTKTKFFKVVLFFAIFCIVSLCKKCDAYAEWYYLSSDYDGIYYSQSTTTYTFSMMGYSSSSDTFYSMRDRSYTFNFDYYDNTTHNIPVNQNMFLKNIVFEYKLRNNFVPASSGKNKYIGVVLDNFIGGGANKSNIFSFIKNPSSLEIDNNFTNLYNFQPYYAEYFDVDLNKYVTCNVILASGSNTSNFGRSFTYVFDIPVGKNVSALKLYMGTIKNYYGTLSDVVNHIETTTSTPQYPMFYYYNKALSMDTYNSSTGNSFLSFTTNNPGSTLSNVKVTPGTTKGYNGQGNIVVRGDNLGSNLWTKSYTFVGTDLNTIIEEQEIEDSIQQQQINAQLTADTIIGGDDEDNKTTGLAGDFSDQLNDYSETAVSGSFTGLFNSLFSYPLTKLAQIKDVDLRYNNGGSTFMNLGLCTGTNNITGDWNDRIRIRFAKPGDTNDTWYYDLPCPHYDLYGYIRHGNYSFLGGNESMLFNGNTTFEFIWRGLMRGLLVYWLFVSCLNVYKYVLDINDTKIEVLSL